MEWNKKVAGLSSIALAMGLATGPGACVREDGDSINGSSSQGLTTAPPLGVDCSWRQEYGNAAHTGIPGCPGVEHPEVSQVITFDQDADARIAKFGFVQINYGSSLTAIDKMGRHHLIVSEVGNFGFDEADIPTDEFFIQDYVRDEATDQYVPDWLAKSDWSSVDKIFGDFGFGPTNGYRMEFTPVVVGDSVYFPRGAGLVERVDLATGEHQATIDTVAGLVDPILGTPLSGDPLTAVSNGLSADDRGNVYVLVNKWDPTPGAIPGTSVFGDPQNQSVLAIVSPSNSVRTVLWTDLVQQLDLPRQREPSCLYPFGVDGVLPTGPGSTGPIDLCGGQRPSFNSPVAVGPNGHLFIKSNDNNATDVVYVLEVDPATLTGVFAYSLVHNMGLDDCGVKEPIITTDPKNFCNILTKGGKVDLGVSSFVGGGDVLFGPEIDANAVTVDGILVCVGGYNGGFIGDGQLGAFGVGICFNTLTHKIFSHNEKSFWDETVAKNVFGQFVMDGLGPTNLGVDSETTTFQTISLGSVTDSTDPLPIGLDRNVMSDDHGISYSVNDDGFLRTFSPDGAMLDEVFLTSETLVGLANSIIRDDRHIIVSTLGKLYVLRTGSSTTAPSARRAMSRAASAGPDMRVTSLRSLRLPAPPVPLN